MKQLIQALVARLFALIATVASPAIQASLERWATNIEDDVPRIGSAWVVQFHDASPDGTPRPNLIDARLHQFGRRVTGVGFVQGEPGDPFKYEGFIKRNVFYGTFRREDAHVLAGTGTFVLKIEADDRTMIGRCTWYHSLIDDVWSSTYIWTRSS